MRGGAAVGETHPQPVTRVRGVDLPERGGDQRRERVDVGAQHDDVAGLQARVVIE